MTAILVVDDMAVIREPIAIALQERGYRTFIAGDGRAALEIAFRERPHLVLLDLTMPHLDGIAATPAVRVRPLSAASRCAASGTYACWCPSVSGRMKPSPPCARSAWRIPAKTWLDLEPRAIDCR